MVTAIWDKMVMASSSVIPWRILQVMQLNNDIARNSRLGWMLTVCNIPSAPPEHGNLSSLFVINIRECVKVNIFSNAVFLFFLIHTFLGIMYKLPNMQFPLLSLRSQRAKLPIWNSAWKQVNIDMCKVIEQVNSLITLELKNKTIQNFKLNCELI